MFNLSFAALTDVDHRYYEGINEVAQTSSTFASSAPYRSLAGVSPTASTFSDDNQDPPLLYWAGDGFSSSIQPPFPTKYLARGPSEFSSITPVSNTNYGSPSEDDLCRKNVRSPPTDTDKDDSPSPGGPVTYLYKKRCSINPIREHFNANDFHTAGGLLHNEGSAEEDLEGDVETEIYGLLEELMDYRPKRATMTSVPLLTLPNEPSSPTDGPIFSRPHADHFFPPLVTPNVSYNGDPDTPSLTPPSPRSPKGSYFSSTSPPLKSKRNFTPVTPSTDEWKKSSSLAAVPERKASTSDYFGYTKFPGGSSPAPHPVPEYVTGHSYPSISSENRRVHHSNLPALAVTIPEDSTIQRREKRPMSSRHAVTRGHSSRVETLNDYPVSSYFSDDDTSESTEVAYIDSSFNPVHLSSPTTISSQSTPSSPRFAPWSGSGSSHEGYSPRSSIRPDFLDYPPPPSHYTPSPRRNMFQSLFSQNSASEQKKGRKRSKGLDSIQTLSLAARSMDAISFTTTSSKSSRDKERKSAEEAERAAKRAQLAAKLKAKQLQRPTDENLSGFSRPTDAQKSFVPWEERGGMYSVDAFL